MTSFPGFHFFPSYRLFRQNLVKNNLRKLLQKLVRSDNKLKQFELKTFMKSDVLISRTISLFPDFSQLFLSSLKTIRTKPIWSTPTKKAKIYLFQKLEAISWKKHDRSHSTSTIIRTTRTIDYRNLDRCKKWHSTTCGYQTFWRSVLAEPKCAEGRARTGAQRGARAAGNRPLGAVKCFYLRSNVLWWYSPDTLAKIKGGQRTSDS